jgi:hypothetical protein
VVGCLRGYSEILGATLEEGHLSGSECERRRGDDGCLHAVDFEVSGQSVTNMWCGSGAGNALNQQALGQRLIPDSV